MTAAARGVGILLACLLAAYGVLLGDADPALVALAGAGVGLVVLGLVATPEWAVWAGVLLLGAVYVVSLALRDGDVDPFAPAVAVGLYLVVEARDVASSGAGAAGSRAWHSLTVGFAAALLVAALLGAGTAVSASGPLAVAATASCGMALLTGLVVFAGSGARQRDD